MISCSCMDQQFVPISFVSIHAPCWCDARINALVCTIVYYAWDLHRHSSVSNAWMHTLIYGSPYNLSCDNLWIFPIESYAWIWSKSGLSSCSFLDRMTLVNHMQISLGNGNSPRLWLDAYHAPLIPIAPASVGNVTWADEDLKNHALHFVSKLVIICHMQLCGFHCISGYSICILVIFPCIFISLKHYRVVYKEFLWPTSTKCDQMSWQLVNSIKNSLNTKRSLHFSVNFIFLTKLVNSLLTGNDLCHSHSMHCKVTETNACHSNSFIVVQWRHRSISSESAVARVLQMWECFTCNVKCDRKFM